MAILSTNKCEQERTRKASQTFKVTLGYQLLGNAFIAHKEGDTGGQIQAGFVETYKSPAPIRYVLTSAVTSIPFIPTPKQPANPTSQLQMQWILDSVRVKNQSRSCLQYSSGTLQVYDVTLSVSLLLSREAWTSI